MYRTFVSNFLFLTMFLLNSETLPMYVRMLSCNASDRHVSCSLTASTADIHKPLSNLRRLIVAEWQALKFRIV